MVNYKNSKIFKVYIDDKETYLITTNSIAARMAYLRKHKHNSIKDLLDYEEKIRNEGLNKKIKYVLVKEIPCDNIEIMNKEFYEYMKENNIL